jgi:hypothetical protein
MLNTTGNSGAIQVVCLDFRKTTKRILRDFLYAGSVQLFTADLLEKNSRLSHLQKSRYVQNKKCRKTFVTPGIPSHRLQKKQFSFNILKQTIVRLLHFVVTSNCPNLQQSIESLGLL